MSGEAPVPNHSCENNCPQDARQQRGPKPGHVEDQERTSARTYRSLRVALEIRLRLTRSWFLRQRPEPKLLVALFVVLFSVSKNVAHHRWTARARRHPNCRT